MILLARNPACHCEERSDEAISKQNEITSLRSQSAFDQSLRGP